MMCKNKPFVNSFSVSEKIILPLNAQNEVENYCPLANNLAP